MKINTKKIKQELKRNRWTLEEFANKFTPKQTRQGAWYLIRHAKNLRSIEKIAKVLDIDPKDLLK
jgi:hypothetical protein